MSALRREIQRAPGVRVEASEYPCDPLVFVSYRGSPDALAAAGVLPAVVEITTTDL